MTRYLPPLNALRAFEAAARHLSFTKGAEELNVTQAAISHQVKALEEALGLALFRRYNRRLALTEAGQAYLPPLREALDSIAAATTRLRQLESSGSLTVSVLPSFAAKWLLPRLSVFRARHPEIDVLVQASNHLSDFRHDGVDVAIRYGYGDYPGHETHFLMGDVIFPVCSPQLATADPPLTGPQDLAACTLLHDTQSEATVTWARWLAAAGVSGIDTARGPGFTDSSLMLQAAIDGQGVALGRRALVGNDLEAGRLIVPFGPRLRSNLRYFVVTPAGGGDRPKIAAFRDWLLAETEVERRKEIAEVEGDEDVQG
ncbi:MAG: transcriptional regulator GcvA [Pseudomonadota bacterium]